MGSVGCDRRPRPNGKTLTRSIYGRRGRAMIDDRYNSPRAFLEALESHGEEAQSYFREWISLPIRRLVEVYKAQFNLPATLESLTARALAAAVAFVRCHRRQQFSSW